MTSNFKNKHCHEDLTSDTESRHAYRAVSIGRAGNKRKRKEEERKNLPCLVSSQCHGHVREGRLVNGGSVRGILGETSV